MPAISTEGLLGESANQPGVSHSSERERLKEANRTARAAGAIAWTAGPAAGAFARYGKHLQSLYA